MTARVSIFLDAEGAASETGGNTGAARPQQNVQFGAREVADTPRFGPCRKTETRLVRRAR